MYKSKTIFRIILFTLFLSIFSNSALAEETVAVQTISVNNPGNNQLNIIYPKFEAYNTTSNFTLNFGVYNNSNIRLTNTTVSCRIIIYETTGLAKSYRNLDYNNNTVTFYQEINATDYDTNRYYYYDLNCNTSGIGGFVSHGFRVSPNGYMPTLDKTLSYFSIGLFLILISILFIWATMQFHFAEAYKPIIYLAGFFGVLNILSVYYVIYWQTKDNFLVYFANVFEGMFVSIIYSFWVLIILGIIILLVKLYFFWKRDKLEGEDEEWGD